MRLGHATLFTAAMALCACSASQPQRNGNGHTEPDTDANAKTAAPALIPKFQVTETAPPPSLPTAKQPVVDPKSTEAAEDVARGFIGLVNRGRFDEAYMLLGPGAPPRADFDRQFASLSDLSATLGTPGDQEGAAGSIYLTIPVQLNGRSEGKRVESSVGLILRRVNDVPGSTEAQRHWHIERIDDADQH